MTTPDPLAALQDLVDCLQWLPPCECPGDDDKHLPNCVFGARPAVKAALRELREELRQANAHAQGCHHEGRVAGLREVEVEFGQMDDPYLDATDAYWSGAQELRRRCLARADALEKGES